MWPGRAQGGVNPGVPTVGAEMPCRRLEEAPADARTLNGSKIPTKCQVNASQPDPLEPTEVGANAGPEPSSLGWRRTGRGLLRLLAAAREARKYGAAALAMATAVVAVPPGSTPSMSRGAGGILDGAAVAFVKGAGAWLLFFGEPWMCMGTLGTEFGPI